MRHALIIASQEEAQNIIYLLGDLVSCYETASRIKWSTPKYRLINHYIERERHSLCFRFQWQEFDFVCGTYFLGETSYYWWKFYKNGYRITFETAKKVLRELKEFMQNNPYIFPDNNFTPNILLMTRTDRIRKLNDIHRTHIPDTETVITWGIRRLTNGNLRELYNLVRNFKDFTDDNDPHHEHDFGSLTYQWEDV